jgi:hypothetical protein
VNHYDLVILLGSQVQFVDGQYQLPPHTQMRADAAGIVLEANSALRLIICGGSNFGVRYDNTDILKPANFSFAAFAHSDFLMQSEATAIKYTLVTKFGLTSTRIFAETLSSTTEENAEFVKIILRRRPMFTGNEKIAILTQLYHMEKALPVFCAAGLNVEPLFAENVLAASDPAQVERICQYYSTPKGGKQYSVERIRQLLTDGISLAGLMQ